MRSLDLLLIDQCQIVIQRRSCLSESDGLYKHPQSTYEDNFLGKTFDIARIIENLIVVVRKSFLNEKVSLGNE